MEVWRSEDVQGMGWMIGDRSAEFSILLSKHTFGFLEMYPVVASRWPEINPRSVDLVEFHQSE